MSRPWLSLYRRIAVASLSVPMGFAPDLQAQTQWQTVEPSPAGTGIHNTWETIPTTDAPANAQRWEPLTPEEETLKPEQLVWTEPTANQDTSTEIDAIKVVDNESEKGKSNQDEAVEEGFRTRDR